jgi:N-acetylmuramoyl-L-alanine amidase CwlA
MSLQIVQKLIPVSRYNWKSYTTMNPIGICIHNTANEASALNEVSYMTRVDEKVSYHYAVDDIQAIQALPENRTAWHAGDNLGQGNMKYIAIEICYSLPKKLPAAEVYAKFDKAEKNAVELVVQILKRYGWGVDRVKKHQDFSGKYCPHRTLDLGWGRFINMVNAQLNPPPVVIPKPFIEGSVVYPIQYVVMTSTAGYSNSTTATLKKGTKSIVMKYHDKNGLYMALGDANGVYYTNAWTKEFNKFSLENPFMDEINELKKQIESLQADLKIKSDQEEYARKLLAEEKALTGSMKITLDEYESRIENIEAELKIKSDSLMEVTKAYNELKGSRFMGIVELLEKLFPKK